MSTLGLSREGAQDRIIGDWLTQVTWKMAVERLCGSVIAADCGLQSPFIRAMGSRYLHCATCVIASQYATSSCKPLLFWFPCKRRYINVRPLIFLTFMSALVCWITIYSDAAVTGWNKRMQLTFVLSKVLVVYSPKQKPSILVYSC